MHVCHKCGREWTGHRRQVGVKEVCEGCGAYLHCCKNCRHHDRSRPNQCRVPNTDTVVDRAGLNFCDEFQFREGAAAGGDSGTETQARDAFGALFGDSDAPVKSPTLDDLFGE